MIHAKLVSFTREGARTLEKIAGLIPDFHVERYERTLDPSLSATQLTRFAQQAMVDCDLIVFVGAAGIAVRAVAPYLRGKSEDPAVIVIDEGGRFAIPILSGHLGGANGFAERIAQGLGAQAVITTATDSRGVFAVDLWAKKNRCAVHDPENIRWVSGALLRGSDVGLKSAFRVDENIPAHILPNAKAETGISVGFDTLYNPFPHTLHIVPRVVHLGLGCRRGASETHIESAVFKTLKLTGIPITAVCAAASIDLKRDEPGIIVFCKKHKLRFQTFTSQELESAEGEFTASEFVERTVGVDNVCERAAALSSGGGPLLCRKTKFEDVTTAIAVERWSVNFNRQ